jgi:type II secretory pathway pseudopilin PulG
MIEIAISLAIIGIALVAIIGVLPRGMDVQRANREETVINQDASVLLEAIRDGHRAGTDLTNYVFAITVASTPWTANGVPGITTTNGYTYSSAFALNNNARIIGLLSTPEFIYVTNVIFPAFPTNNLFSGGYSNRVYAYVHSLSGPAVEKPPQDNALLVGNSFSYCVLCVNSPVATDTNLFNLSAAQQAFSSQLGANLHELRLTFFWPWRGDVPTDLSTLTRLTQRSMVAGSITWTNDNKQMLYFYQPQLFNNAP